MNLDRTSGAVFSRCRRYRYALWRAWDTDAKRVLFIGLNPSTADETRNDPTVRRCIGFAHDWGYGSLAVANIFAFRATRPADLFREREPVGRANDRWIARLYAEADLVVAAWGVHGIHRERGARVAAMLKGVRCLGVTRDGWPRHPLYTRRDLRPLPWNGGCPEEGMANASAARP